MQKFEKLQKVIEASEADCWLSLSDEKSDPYLEKYLFAGTGVVSMAIVTARESVLLVHDLDYENAREIAGLSLVRFSSRNDLWVKLGETLARLGWPKQIALSFSEHADIATDVLRHGAFLLIRKRLNALYRSAGRKFGLLSAAPIFYAMSESRTLAEVQRMRLAAARAHELLEGAFSQIRPGMTELEVMQKVQALMKRPSFITRRKGVIAEELAWEADGCPIVLAGPNLTKGGHAKPSSFRLRAGHTVYFDFGITLVFKDGERWSSDIQRMGYILKAGEKDAPPEVRRIFDTLVQSIEEGAKLLKPGTPGYEVDRVVRGIIVRAGYPSYGHATGHPVAEGPHGMGTVLAEKPSRLALLRVQELGVYTLEPRIAISNGGSVEEMVLCTEHGGDFISPRQTALYLINAG